MAGERMNETEEIAEVILKQGRWVLVVHGIFVAMEGDICRDPLYGRVWEYSNLLDASNLICQKRWASAKDRWEMK